MPIPQVHLDELRDDANQKRKLTRKAVAAAKRGTAQIVCNQSERGSRS